MNRKIKAIISGILICILLLGTAPVCMAAELPNAIWPLLDAYTSATTDRDIIQVGTQIIDLLHSVTMTDQIKEILASKYYDVADAYDRQGNFPMAAEYYRGYIPYGTFMGWTDGVKIAEAKVKHYTPTVEAYTDSDTSVVFFGAKNEPEKGVLYGQVSEAIFYGNDARESMTLLYIDYGKDLSDWDRKVLSKAEQKGAAVEIAWNFQGQATDVLNVLNQGEYIRSFLQSLNEYRSIPIYLRIGAEVNTWYNKPTPDAYISAFRFIASLVHQVSPQIATVWSVSHASSWDANMTDFYPGDEYVDWVGISAYMIRYFQGKQWAANERFNEVVFCTGDAADPVILVSEVLREFGDRKPIMLAECGSAYYTNTLGIDSTDWAVTNLRRMYTYVPMVYPQVKMISYFNVPTPGEAQEYALSGSPQLKEAYNQAVKEPHFIQDRYDQKDADCYRKLENGMQAENSLSVYTYPHIFGDAEPQVTYYIDGNFAGSSAKLPYSQQLDFSAYQDGQHTLRVAVVSGGAEVVSKEYVVNKTREIKILVNNQLLTTDVSPVLSNGRTLVPLRAIFEALGATVSWDNTTNTASAVKGGTTVYIQINSNVLYKNAEEIPLDVPAQLISDRTMVPARAVSEAFGASVSWDDATGTVIISY